MDIAEEWERDLAGLRERGVAERAVGADAKDSDVAFRELCGDLAQAAQLRGSDAAPVVAVEDQDHIAAAQVREMDLPAGCRREREVGRGLAEP
jgi:hypothetical protein